MKSKKTTWLIFEELVTEGADDNNETVEEAEDDLSRKCR